MLFCMGTAAYGFNNAPVMLQLSDEEEQFIQTHPVVRVSNELDWPPFDFAISGQPFGFSIDLMNLLGQRLGLELEYINGYRWNELVELFKTGEIDVLQSVYKNKERATYGLFTRPYFRDKTVFIISRYATPISRIEQLKGKIIAAPKGWAYEKFILDYYPDINLLSVKNMADAFRAITNGKADAAIELSAVAQFMFEKHYFDSLKISGWFEEYDSGQKKSLHLLVRKEWAVLHGMLEKALESLTPGELIELEKKWLGYRNIYPHQKLTLTAEEKAFLLENPVIRVANELDWPPFDYTEHGKPAGFSMDYIALIGEMIGVQFEIVNGFSWPQLLEKGRKKEIDVFPAIWKTPEREPFLKFTSPYMNLAKVLVSKSLEQEEYNSLSQLKGKKIALSKGYALTELIIKEHPGPDYVIVKNNADGLNQLAIGSVDGFVGTLGVINHIIKKHFISDVRVLMQVELSRDLPLQIAVREDWPVMLDIINKAMENITPEQYDILATKWIGTIEDIGKIESLSMEEKLYIEQKKEICICVPDEMNAPYEYISENGGYEGIVAEYYKFFSKKTGIPLKWKFPNSTAQLNKEMKSGGCDLISIAESGGKGRKDIHVTMPYIEYPLVIVTDSRALFISDIENLSEKSIGIISGTSFFSTLVKMYPNINFISVDGVEQGLSMVQKGEIFGFIDTAPKIGHHIQNKKMVDLKISGEIPHRIEFRSGVHKENKVLLNILEKSRISLTLGEKNHLFQNWMSITYQKDSDYRLLWKLGIVLMLVSSFFVYRHISVTRYNRKLAALNREFIQANRKLEAISYIDGLTQIPNRRRFDVVLSNEWQRCERNQRYLTLIMLDIDYFKLYNDRYGHLSGDECLKKVAEALNRVPGRVGDFVGRYGGEEFGIILPDTDERGAKAVAQKILSDIEYLKISHEDSTVSDYVSVSLGVASVVPSRLLFPRQLVDFADQLLYQAKNSGRNRYEFLILE